LFAGVVRNVSARKLAEERRDQLAGIVASSDDAIISETLDGIVTSWNQGAERLFGYCAAEAIGRSVFFIMPPGRIDEESFILAKIARGERVEPHETVRVRKNGECLEVSLSVSPVRDSTGAVIGAAKIARDIGERKQSEEQLRAALKEITDIKAALDEHSIVAVTDAAGRITSVNDKFCAISKYSRAELLGQDHRIINSRRHPKEFFRDLWTTIARGNVWRGEIQNRAKDGSLYWVDTTIFPVLGASGKPAQYIAIRTDITERKHNEQQLAKLAGELAEKNKDLETVVYIVSHDLRAPLVNVQGFGKQLSKACDKIRAAVPAPESPEHSTELRQVLDTSIPQALRFIHAGIAKMDALLSGFLKFSRLGRVALNVGPVDMNATLKGVVEAVRFQIDQIGAEMAIESLPPCQADATQIGLVFSNLIDNAMKYRDPARTLRISIAGQTEGTRAIYTVTDNGIGVAPEHQSRIFEIFHRLNPNATSGEGLGLTIAQRILERQQGKLWVESRLGSGSTFFVSIPAVVNP
jgi:PAS domain S-box-containing protein